uniref:PH domain-containing protein n=1 Tax=Globisporangium ultimum (strain ATCC 200006 / CBS 805.95 / DAOM BR144) TaxID=431595 RepID=K3WGN4_GLOUD
MTCCKKDDTVVALDGYAAGYLIKRGERIKTWKRRYFVFQRGCLSYRKDSRDNSKTLRSDLVLNVSYYEGKKHGLSVRLMSGRELYLSALNEEQASIWLEVIEEFLAQQRRQRELHYVHGKRNKHMEPIVESDCDYDSDRNTFTM